MGEDGIEDSLYAGSIGEDAHGPGSPSKLPESPFNEIGGSDLFPELSVFNPVEGQEFFFTFFERSQGLGVGCAPVAGKAFQSAPGLFDSAGMADGSQVLLGGFLIHFANVVEDVSGFVSPAALDGDARINEGQSRPQSLPAIRHDQVHPFRPQTSLV